MSLLQRDWIWLFPATYLIHILEEALAGEVFYRWIGRVIRRRLTPRAFLTLNGIFLAAMTAATIALRAGGAAWLLPALGAVTAINGLGHLVGGALTHRYSPGTVSGMLLWFPLGLTAMAISMPALPIGLWLLGIGAGILMSAAVVLLAFVFSHRP